jgi:transglutaminase-like putative cysteine protease
MTAQRTIGFVLVALQAAMLAYMSHNYMLPALAAGIALVGLLRPLRLEWPIGRRVIAALLLAVTMAAKWRLMPGVPRDNLIMDQGLGVGLGQFFLLLQASLFHFRVASRKNPMALSKALPAYTAAVLTCAGDFSAHGPEIGVYRASAMAFLVLAMLYIPVTEGYGLVPRRFPLRAAIVVTLILIANAIAWSSATIIGDNRALLDEIFLAPLTKNLSPPQSVGFSGTAQLGSINHVKSTDEDKPALRVFAAGEPGYLRGKAFITFNGTGWDADTAEIEASSDTPLPLEPPRTHPWPLKGFRLDEGKGPWNLYEVSTAADYPVAFTPLGTGILAAPSEVLHVSDSGLAEGLGLTQYAAYVPGNPQPLAELTQTRRDRYALLPEKVDPGVRALAEGLFRNCGTVSEKIEAVEHYFHTQYRYNLGIQIPYGEDPMTYFLLKKPAAHCEYFASGATLLLRLGGVPCRYVTGFVASERNARGGYWLARNRDAHAWCEAYDDSTGWRIVEATPSSGVPQEREANSGFWDDWRFRLREFMGMSFRDMLRTALAASLRVLIAVAIAGGVLAGLWKLFRRLRKQGLSALFPRKRQPDPLLTLLIQMDNAVAAKGYRRAQSETLHRFAARLAQSDDPALHPASDWYRAYAETRYGHPDDQAAYAKLRETAERAKN